MDNGPWTYRYDEETRELYVESGDFKHDVTLTVNGDFRNKAERVRYAEWLAGRLNAVRVTITMREGERNERVDR